MGFLGRVRCAKSLQCAHLQQLMNYTLNLTTKARCFQPKEKLGFDRPAEF